jgi:hypothetical protein
MLEAQTIDDFGHFLNLSNEDLEHLRMVFVSVDQGDLRVLTSLGIEVNLYMNGSSCMCMCVSLQTITFPTTISNCLNYCCFMHVRACFDCFPYDAGNKQPSCPCPSHAPAKLSLAEFALILLPPAPDRPPKWTNS